MLGKLVIRPLVADDLPALEWEGQYQHFRRLFSATYQDMQRGRNIMWVAELPVDPLASRDSPATTLVGQLFVQLTSARQELADGYLRAYIYAFRVKPAFRSQGIGTRLMEEVETDLRQRRFGYVTLNVGKDNPGARRFYEKRGYRVVAEEPGCWSYIDDTGQRQEVCEPAWRMEKRL